MAYTDRINPVTGIILLHPLTITFVLLTTSYPIHYQIPTAFWFIILSSFILAMIFLLLQIRVGEKALQFVIFLSDVPLIGAVVYFSRGIESMFPLLYIILIIVSAIQLYRTGAYIISMAAVIFFLGLIIVDIFRTEVPTGLVMQRFYMFSLLFLFTAILSGSLSERYRIRTEEVVKLKLTTDEIIRNMPSGVITIDQSGDIILTNIKDEALRSHAHLQIARFLKDQDAVIARELFINQRYYFLSCARIPGGQGALGVLQDLTDIRRLEETSRISKQTKMLAELGGSLAHEIRNPLASIKGSLEVISRSAGKKIKPFVAMALKESTRLNGIVTDFLNFAQFTPHSLNRMVIGDILTEAVLEAAARFANKKISVVRDNNDFYIMADPDRMKGAFVNILSNAYEASADGSIITIRTTSEKKWGVIAVGDHGHGIAKKDLPKIFVPFFTMKKGGTGLGLSISQRIIEAHNGRIEVTSVVGEGTTFKVLLPLA